jgi:tetratricopeptide (TPR) repeat protein
MQRVQRSRGDTVLPPDESVLVATFLDDSIAVERALADLDQTSDWAVTITTVVLAQLAQRPDLAERTARRLVTSNHAREVRAFGWEVLSNLALARGHLRESLACLDSASVQEPRSASIARGLLLVSPFIPPAARPDSATWGFADRLGHWAGPDAVRLFLFWFDYDRVRDDAVRPYLAALLRYKAKHGPVRAMPLANFPLATSSGDSIGMASALLSPSIAAWAALAAGDTTAALDTFQRSWEGIEFSQASFSAFMTRPWDVYETGELLEARGDLAGAAAWYGNAGWVGLHDIAYLAPGQIRRGLALERLGRRDEARSAYQRALRYWQTPDVEFQPLADSAARRLAALTP